ncbi:hypothetical protein GCM10010266_69370 [Streptomyces griseomycini]|nr:hypothetical protein GCM10010266_69370 [Streptomyces griseomycini]
MSVPSPSKATVVCMSCASGVVPSSSKGTDSIPATFTAPFTPPAHTRTPAVHAHTPAPVPHQRTSITRIVQGSTPG